MTLAVVVLIVLFVLWRRASGRRKDTRAGLDSTRPAFSLAPPRRWSTSRKDHML